MPSDWAGHVYAAAQSRQLRGALRPLSYILIAGVAGVLLLVATATAPVLFGYHTYIINGGSMEPALTRGSVAVTHPTSPRALRVGDIIAYQHTPENPPVLHRIVEVTNDNGQLGFITQGDQNQAPDSQPASLQGPGDKVVYSVPYAGYVLSFAESNAGRVALIGVPLALLVILFLRENLQSAKAGKQRDAEFAAHEAPAALAGVRTERALDPRGDQLPAAPAPLARLRAERALDPVGDHVAVAPPVAGPFQPERSQSDLPVFLVRQLQSRGPVEPGTQPAAAGSTGGPAGLRESASPEWPQRKTRRVA